MFGINAIRKFKPRALDFKNYVIETSPVKVKEEPNNNLIPDENEEEDDKFKSGYLYVNELISDPPQYMTQFTPLLSSSFSETSPLFQFSRCHEIEDEGSVVESCCFDLQPHFNSLSNKKEIRVSHQMNERLKMSSKVSEKRWDGISNEMSVSQMVEIFTKNREESAKNFAEEEKQNLDFLSLQFLGIQEENVFMSPTSKKKKFSPRRSEEQKSPLMQLNYNNNCNLGRHLVAVNLFQ